MSADAHSTAGIFGGEETAAEGRSNAPLRLLQYESELELPELTDLIQQELSEPYSIYTYRYFLHNWPELCFVVRDGSRCVGAIICKLDRHREQAMRGYIAMLVVDKAYRKRGIGSRLAEHAISRMRDSGADEVVLETEVTNTGALALYENLGFVRDKRLYRYYLNGIDAFRLKLWFTPPGAVATRLVHHPE